MSESGKSDLQLRIEIGIAKFWPDYQRIAAYAGITVSDVYETVEEMDALEGRDDMPQEYVRRAQAEYRKLHRHGLTAERMPLWVQEGHKVAERQRYVQRKLRAAS